MGKAVKAVEYEVVRVDKDRAVIRRADGRTASVQTHWLVVEGGRARAVSQVKQLRIEGLVWE
ncbi:MAG: hypothetical protein FWH21_00565 [Kiritimatiellaeota bacterium]|nr:hypothetical protein [Kiritimatiellota bacterium]